MTLPATETAGQRPYLERTTGFEPATPTLANGWSMSHASPPVSTVSLGCTFLALLSHASHQIAGVDPISLVISLVLLHGRAAKRECRQGESGAHQWATGHREGPNRFFQRDGRNVGRKHALSVALLDEAQLLQCGPPPTRLDSLPRNPTIRRGIPVSVRRTADPTRPGCSPTRRRGRRSSRPRWGLADAGLLRCSMTRRAE